MFVKLECIKGRNFVTGNFSSFELSFSRPLITVYCCTQRSVASYLHVMSCFVNQVVEELSKVEGLSKILVAEHEAYKGFLPGNQENLNCKSFYFYGE